MSQLKISIPEPCTQNWADMTATEKGRYCSSCEKEVIDFRNWSANELQNWFVVGNDRVCGRLSQKQLDNFKPAITQHSSWGFSAKVLLTSALAMFITSRAHSNTTVKNSVSIYENKNTNRAKVEEDIRLSDSLIIIKGVVTAKEDKLPLPGVSIFLKNGGILGSTGVDGRFMLKIKADPDQKLLLEFRCLGYGAKELEITPGLDQYDQKLEMAYDEKLLVMGAVVICVKRPSLPKRIWNFIKRPFVSRH